GPTQKSLCRIQELISLDQFAIAFTGKWRDLRYGTGSGYYGGARSLPLPVPYRIRPAYAFANRHRIVIEGAADRGERPQTRFFSLSLCLSVNVPKFGVIDCSYCFHSLNLLYRFVCAD